MSMNSTAIQQSPSSQINFKQIKKKQRMRSFSKGILFLLPSIALFSVFLFYPLARTIYLSFFLTDATGKTTVFVGWENYVTMFTSPIFLQSMKSTFLFVLYTVPITIIISLFLAVIANEKLKGIGFFRTIFFIDHGDIGGGCICLLALFISSINWSIKSIVKLHWFRGNRLADRSVMGTFFDRYYNNMDEYRFYLSHFVRRASID